MIIVSFFYFIFIEAEVHANVILTESADSTSQYNANYVIYHPLTWSQIKI